MENLRPERDELDQFRGRQSKARPSPQAASTSKADKQTASAARSGSPVMLMMLLLLIAGVSYLGWENYQQKQLVSNMKQEQEEAAGFISQSKLLLARLQGELSETGAEMAESGTATDKKLAFLDAEMRKLWGVSNDKNKKAIQSNEEALAKLSDRVNSLEQGSKSAQASMKVLQTSLTEKVEKLDVDAAALKQGLDSMSTRVSDVSTSSVVVLAEVEGLRQELDTIKKVADRMKETDKVLASIDASRQQLVQRVVELERRLGDLQRSAAAKPSTETKAPGQNGLQVEMSK